MTPTKEEMKVRAWAIAEQHFYCDDECDIAWEPFEYWDDEDLKEEVADLANRIFNAMIWAQGDEDENK